MQAMKLMKTTGVAVSAALAATLTVAMDSGPSERDGAPDVKGVVTGTIVFDGKQPEVKPLVISAEQSKGCCAQGVEMNTVDRSLLISDKGGLANVVVTLEVPDEELEIPKEPVPFDQVDCRFQPHVKVLPAGATLIFLNSDEVSHNIHTYAAKNDGENKTVAPGNGLKYKLEKGEAVKITCDIHPWMLGWVYVSEANRWAVSEADGSFEIKDVPPGDYKLTIWHEKLGKAKATAVVGPDGSSEPLEVKMSTKKKSGRRRR